MWPFKRTKKYEPTYPGSGALGDVIWEDVSSGDAARKERAKTAYISFMAFLTQPTAGPVLRYISALEDGRVADVAQSLEEGWKAQTSFPFLYDYTPLHLAAHHGHKDLASFLLRKGADPNARDAAGRTPLDRAASQGHPDVVELLSEKKGDPGKGQDKGGAEIGAYRAS
jgi:hypothetical protein